MTLETFFEKFDQFADAPDATAKIRELVLELAVQGKLVAASPKPEKHAAWLAFRKEISERVYSYDPGPPPPFEIPDQWEWCVLDEVADCRASAKVSPASIADTDWVLDLEDIDGTKGQIIQTATFAERRSLSTKAAFEPGDVLYGKLRPYLNKVVVASKRGFCTTEIIPLRPAAFLSPEFLRFYLRSRTFLRYAAQKNYGMKMPRLGTKDLESAEIPIPPPAEQKRIVAKVDELMALCDRLEAQQQERETRHAALARASLARFAEAPNPANLPFLFHPSYAIPPADLRKSILTLAVQGKLVPQDPNDEPGDQILRRIHSGTSSKKAANGSMASDDLGELPFGLPNGWSVSRLGSILLPTRGISYGVIKLGPEPQQGGVFILRCSNVRFRRIDLNGIRKVTEQLSSEYGRTILEGGEVLINVRGTLGGCAVVPPALKGYNIAREVAVIPVHSEIDPTFLLNVIASPYFQDRVDENLRGIAYEGLNLGLLRDFLVPIPPLAEQRRIVAKVEQLMALVDALETQLAASRATAANLLSALVAELTTP